MAKKSPKLTILVPVYNVAEYLPLCIESIVNQSFKDFECILINDGSTDDSLSIIKKYSKSDKRFVVIDKKNSGYGATLNEGIKKAKGEYIGIVEPDDFIHRDFYKILFEKEADIMKCGYMNFYGKTWKTEPERIFSEVRRDFPVNGVTIKPSENNNIFLVNPTVWSAVYKKTMLEKNDIKFLETEGASYQDAGFQFKAFVSAEKIICIEKPLYYYRRDNNSSSVKSDEKINAVKNEFDSVDTFVSKKPEYKEIADCCRFRSYNWNLNRLSFKKALAFAKVARRDYKEKKFDTSYFKRTKQYRPYELKFSTKHPVGYVYLRPLFKIHNNLKRSIRNFIKRKK